MQSGLRQIGHPDKDDQLAVANKSPLSVPSTAFAASSFFMAAGQHRLTEAFTLLAL